MDNASKDFINNAALQALAGLTSAHDEDGEWCYGDAQTVANEAYDIAFAMEEERLKRLSPALAGDPDLATQLEQVRAILTAGQKSGPENDRFLYQYVDEAEGLLGGIIDKLRKPC